MIIIKFCTHQDTVEFFNKHYNKKLSVYDKLEFLNMWYVLIIINDILTIVGSAIKIQIENKVIIRSDLYKDLERTFNSLRVVML